MKITLIDKNGKVSEIDPGKKLFFSGNISPTQMKKGFFEDTANDKRQV